MGVGVGVGVGVGAGAGSGAQAFGFTGGGGPPWTGTGGSGGRTGTSVREQLPGAGFPLPQVESNFEKRLLPELGWAEPPVSLWVMPH